MSNRFAVVVAGILWGTTGVVVQLIRHSAGLNPISIGFYRLAVAAIALSFFSVRHRHQFRTQAGPLLITGIGLGVYQALYFLAVAWIGVAVATVVSLGLAPVLIAGWEAARSRQRPARTTLCSITAAIAGLALITGFTGGVGPRPLLGLLAAAACGAGYASTTILNRHLSRHVRPLAMTASTTAVGALTLLPFAWLTGDLNRPMAPATGAMLVYLGLVATAVAYALFYAGLRTTTGSSAAVLTLLEPLTAAVLAVAVLGEKLSFAALLGGGLLLAAVALTIT